MTSRSAPWRRILPPACLAAALAIPARAQIGSDRYSAIVVDANGGIRPPAPTSTSIASPPASPR